MRSSRSLGSAQGLTGEVNATVANYDEIDVDGALGFDLGERAAARLSVVSLQSKGYQENKLLGTDEGAADVLAGRAQLLFAPNDDLEFLLNVHGSRDDSELTPYKQLGLVQYVDPVNFVPCPTPGSAAAARISSATPTRPIITRACGTCRTSAPRSMPRAPR